MNTIWLVYCRHYSEYMTLIKEVINENIWQIVKNFKPLTASGPYSLSQFSPTVVSVDLIISYVGW